VHPDCKYTQSLLGMTPMVCFFFAWVLAVEDSYRLPSINERRLRDLDGWRNLRSAFASI
jgi:hypothetical protein